MSRRKFWLFVAGAALLYVWGSGMIAAQTSPFALAYKTQGALIGNLLVAGLFIVGSLTLWCICSVRRCLDHGWDWEWTLPSTPLWIWQILKVGYLISAVNAGYASTGVVAYLLTVLGYVAVASLLYLPFMLWKFGIQKTPKIRGRN